MMVMFFLLCGSCNNSAKKNVGDINKTVITQVEEGVKKGIESGDISIQELMISQKLVYFLAPLVLALFVSIILVFLGVRLVGLGILVSSITCIILVVALSIHIQIVGVVGIFVLLAGIYFLGREIHNQSILKKDLYNSVEVSKLLLPAEKREVLKKSLNRIQSENTQNIVKDLKKSIKR